MKYLKLVAALLLFAVAGIFTFGLVFSMVSNRFNFPTDKVKFAFWFTLLPFIVLPVFYGVRLVKNALKKERLKKADWVPLDSIISIECSVSLTDYVLFNMGLIFSRGIFVVATVIIFLGAVNFFTFRQQADLATYVPLLLVLVLVPGAVLYNMYKTYNNTPHISYSTKYLFSNEGIQAANELGSGNVVWKSIIRVRNTKKFLLLFNTPVTCYFLKKEAFNRSDLQQLEKFLNSNFQVE
jgi:hypothetical protein